MRVPRLYLPQPLAVGESVVLENSTYQHAVQVLRLKPGMAVSLFNGTGGEFQAMLEVVERRTARVRIVAFDARTVESRLDILLVQAISKGERMDYTLQKAVELGVNAVQPVFAERSVVELRGDRLAQRLRHWRGVAAGACEQCGRNVIPAVLEPQGLRAWLERQDDIACALVLDPEAEHGLRALGEPAGRIILLIGPEGGLTAAETARAKARGFRAVRLGPRVLRTETAGVAALAALQALWGDLG